MLGIAVPCALRELLNKWGLQFPLVWRCAFSWQVDIQLWIDSHQNEGAVLCLRDVRAGYMKSGPSIEGCQLHVGGRGQYVEFVPIASQNGKLILEDIHVEDAHLVLMFFQCICAAWVGHQWGRWFPYVWWCAVHLQDDNCAYCCQHAISEWYICSHQLETWKLGERLCNPQHQQAYSEGHFCSLNGQHESLAWRMLSRLDYVHDFVSQRLKVCMSMDVINAEGEMQICIMQTHTIPNHK